MDISVIIPAFNRETALAACLASLARQDFPASRWEALVIDDGSTDRTRAVAESWLGHVPLTVLATGARGGQGPARNLGVRSARGSVLVFIDSDVLAPPWFLRAHALSHEARRCFVDGPAISIEGDAPPTDPPFEKAWVRLLAWIDRWGAPFVTVNASCRTADFVEAGGFDEAFGARYGWEDSELGVRLSARGLRRERNRCAYVLHWHVGQSDWLQRGRKQEDAGFNAAHFVARHPQPAVRRWVGRRLRLGLALAACGVDAARSTSMCLDRNAATGPPEWIVQIHEAACYATGFSRGAQADGGAPSGSPGCT